MNKTLITALISLVFFYFVYQLHSYLLVVLAVKDLIFAQQFFQFISILSVLMLSNLVLFQVLKPKMLGFVFLGWSLLKIMLIMAYFVFFVMKKNLQLANSTIYEFVIIYMIYLFFEVLFTIFLLKEKAPKSSGAS